MASLICRLNALEDLVADLDGGTGPACPTLGWVAVDADGTVLDSCGGATGTRAALGRYDLVPPPGAKIVTLTVVEEEGTRDSIEIHPTSIVGTRVHISEGDNGTSPNIYRDRAFTAVWH